MFWLPSVMRSSAFEVFLVNALVALSYGERYVYGPEAQVSDINQLTWVALSTGYCPHLNSQGHTSNPVA